MRESDTMTERQENPSRDFLLLLTLFVAFRLGSVLFFRPGGHVRDYSDLIFYQNRASWQDFGFLPYRDYWSEYPPLFAWLTVGIDRIARLIPAWDDQRLWFAALFGLVTVAAETLTLVALYRLARRIYGDGALRVAWLYALLFLPVYLLGGWYDALPVATIMGGLALGLSRLAATEFSFFLAIPAMLGASAVKLMSAREAVALGDIPLFAVGFIVSFVVALVVIRGLLAFISRNSFVPFAWYRIIFGVALLVLFWLSIGVF